MADNPGHCDVDSANGLVFHWLYVLVAVDSAPYIAKAPPGSGVVIVLHFTAPELSLDVLHGRGHLRHVLTDFQNIDPLLHKATGNLSA